MNKLILGNCFEIIKELKDNSIDMILTDPPYNITRNKWDVKIDINLMFELFFKKIKENGVIAIFGKEPFSSNLRLQNNFYRYDWKWYKRTPTGFLNAKKMPLSVIEDILIFYKKLPTYNPIKTLNHEKKIAKRIGKYSNNYNEYGSNNYNSDERYPINILISSTDKQKTNLHPTQKPVSILEYLIKTYSNKNNLILDPFMGSGSTIIATMNTNRKYIGIEKDSEIFNTAEKRVDDHIKSLDFNQISM